MRRYFALAFAGLLAFASTPFAQQGALQSAAAALGAGNIKTLQFTGSGENFSVGQNFTSTDPWPHVTVKNYTALINYDTGSMRVELLRESGPVMPRGGGAPFFGEQRQIQLVSGDYAWNQPVPAANAPAGGAPPAAAPNPDARSLGDTGGLREGGDGEQRHDQAVGQRHRGVVHRRWQVQDDRNDQQAGAGRESADLD